MILMSISVFAQTRGTSEGAGYIWTDSLGYQSGDEAGVAADSAFIIDVRFSKSWYRIFVAGNANSPVDSFYLQLGSVRYNEGGVAQDTTWGSWTLVKDSVWGDINTMINNVVGKDFLVFSPIAQLMKYALLNDRATLNTRNVVITIQAIKN